MSVIHLVNIMNEDECWKLFRRNKNCLAIPFNTKEIPSRSMAVKL